MDSNMHSAVFAAPTEFRSLKRDYPHALVRMLMCVTYAYGLLLTLTLPWTFGPAILRAFEVGWVASIAILILVALCFITMARWCIVQAAAFVIFDAEAQRKPVKASVQPFVSILVPAYNEAKTLTAAIQSLVNLDYPAYEVIVVDDGSTDETHAIASALEGEYDGCSVRVCTKPNGGKWSALNFAYNNSSGDLLLCVDADSHLRKDALWIAVARMQADPKVVAVAGQVTIRNRTSVLMHFQALEYLLGNGGLRMCLSAFGIVTVVPGPIGLYRRSIFEKVAALPCNARPVASHGAQDGNVYGPLSGETFAEDAQLSLSALALGGKIVYEPRAVAFTKAPNTVDSLLSQRYRWNRGTWQVMRIYRRDLREHAISKNPRCDLVVNASCALDLYVLPLVNFAFWGYLVTAGALGVALPGAVLWLAGLALVNLMTATVYAMVQEDDFALLPLALFMDLYMTVVVTSAWFIAAIDEARGARMKWH